jgi:hypothetical protein
MNKPTRLIVSSAIALLFLLPMVASVDRGYSVVPESRNGGFSRLLPDATLPLVEFGKLTDVDPGAQSIWIRTEAGEDRTFRYDEATRILGVGDAVECFGPSVEPSVKVSYNVSYEAAERAPVALEIEVLSKEQL